MQAYFRKKYHLNNRWEKLKDLIRDIAYSLRIVRDKA
jgi:hypothetical protein